MKKIVELAINKAIDLDFLKFIDRCIAIFNELVDGVTFKAWTNFELLNGWVNYSNLRTEASYTKNGQGIVRISGFIKSGTITSGTVIAKIPLDHAPPRIISFAVLCDTSITVCRLDINTTGELLIYGAVGNTYISLEGVSYLV